MTTSLTQRMALIIILASAANVALTMGDEKQQPRVGKYENRREFNLDFKNVVPGNHQRMYNEYVNRFNDQMNNLKNELNKFNNKAERIRGNFDANDFREEKIVQNVVKEVKYNGRPVNYYGDNGQANQRVVRRVWVDGRLVEDVVQEELKDYKPAAKYPNFKAANNINNAYDKYFNPMEKEMLGDAYKFLPDRKENGQANDPRPERGNRDQKNDERVRIMGGYQNQKDQVFAGYEEQKFKRPANNPVKAVKREIIKINGDRVIEYENGEQVIIENKNADKKAADNQYKPVAPVIKKDEPKIENPLIKPAVKDAPNIIDPKKEADINDVYAYINKNREARGLKPIIPYNPETNPVIAEKKVAADIGIEKKQDPPKVVQNIQGNKDDKVIGAANKPKENIVVDAKVNNYQPYVKPANGDYKNFNDKPVVNKDADIQMVKKVYIPDNADMKKNPVDVVDEGRKDAVVDKNLLSAFHPERVSNGGELEPLEIIWEVGAVKRMLEDSNMKEKYVYFKELMKKASAILRMFVAIPKSERNIIKIGKGQQCDRYLKDPMSFDTHLVMLAYVFAPKDQSEEKTIAWASACRRTSTERTDIGIIGFNGYKLVGEKSNDTEKYNFLMTVVHETLHALAFHHDADRLLIKKEVASYLQNLAKIKNHDPYIYDSGHWDDQYIPNDVMIPTSKSNTLVTVYTLEMVAHRSLSYKVNYGNLMHNSFTENIVDVENFFNYKCYDFTEKSKYHQFCSPKEAQQKKWGCSPDYVFQNNCGSRKLKNGCFSRNVDERFNCMDPLVTKEVFEKTGPYQYRGTEGRCFESDQNSAVCLKSGVVGNDVVFYMGGQQYKCQTSGEVINARFFKTQTLYLEIPITCPDLDQFKQAFARTICPNNCHNNGFCSLGKCICYDGYDSNDNCKTKAHTHYETLMFSEVLRDK